MLAPGGIAPSLDGRRSFRELRSGPSSTFLRIAFQSFGGRQWLGGVHYLATLLSVLRDHAHGVIEPLLFVRPGTDPSVVAQLSDLLALEPIPVGGAKVGSVAWCADQGVFQKDRWLESACRREGVDLVYQHSEWLGLRFGIPTLAWLGDFQHRVLPEMFPAKQYWMREARFRAVLRSASLLYVLSETDLRFGRRFYDRASEKLRALTFAVTVPPQAWALDPALVARRYELPDRYFLFPGQLWKHKNHLRVVDAVGELKRCGRPVAVAACGMQLDHRDPDHPGRVVRRIQERGLEAEFRLLGVLPRPEVWALMRGSLAVINPSLYEGWSTPVEEAKSLGVPILLSDLEVHREQSPRHALFFDPRSVESIADALDTASTEWKEGPHLDLERAASDELPVRRAAFAQSFIALAEEAIRNGSRDPASMEGVARS